MKSEIRLREGLPFVKIKLINNGTSKLLDNVLVDTGSASTIIKLELVEEIGLVAEPGVLLGSIAGVGGNEIVFIKQVDAIEINELRVENFQIDIGIMDYGFNIDGILGMDFLVKDKKPD